MKKVLALFALLALTACSGQPVNGPTAATADSQATQEQADPAALTIGLTYIPDVQFAPVYVALEKGYFTDEGLDVTIRHHGAQESLLGALQSGEEDVVFAGGDEMMQARSTGVDVVNWATMYQRYPVVLIAKTDSGITSPADLAGKSVGLPGPYGENYFGLLAMQKAYGLDDMQVDYIGYTQAAALSSGQVDAIIGFTNNDAVSMRHAGIDVVEMPLVEGDLPLVGVGLGSINVEPETMAKVLAAMERATADAAADIEGTLDIVTGYVPTLAEPDQRELAGKVLEATLKLYTGGESFGAQDEQAWEAMSAFLEDNGLLEQPVPATEAYTLDVLKARTN
ncbi:ABC transporter substrate-binding protein [Trueperella bernardiae]|uniref:ABC transporter substrate-binding protein n=1 Tax=Trueperella bernardiae TaxID=59561 RepID=UPI002552BF30|nr:ABC transporter substrate-binding protein [Trueperella bernardiae]WIM08766.1 ABC transporter substrate-binding protein [Trueperella bernardiae]